MSVAISPSVEAMQAIVSRINSGTYQFSVRAKYGEAVIDELEDLEFVTVDVISESEQQLNETIDIEDRTSHLINVWIRRKVNPDDTVTIDRLKLTVRQMFQRLNDYDSPNGRVKIWELDSESKKVPDKTQLVNNHVFIAALMLRAEVEAS